MINRAVLINPDLIKTMDVFNDGKDTKNWLHGIGEHILAKRVDDQIQARFKEMRSDDDRPFIIRIPGSELYWNADSAWVDRANATVYSKRGPDLSIGERVYVADDEAAALIQLFCKQYLDISSTSNRAG